MKTMKIVSIHRGLVVLTRPVKGLGMRIVSVEDCGVLTVGEVETLRLS